MEISETFAFASRHNSLDNVKPFENTYNFSSLWQQKITYCKGTNPGGGTVLDDRRGSAARDWKMDPVRATVLKISLLFCKEVLTWQTESWPCQSKKFTKSQPCQNHFMTFDPSSQRFPEVEKGTLSDGTSL